MKRAVVLVALVAAGVGAWASPAHATSECRGLNPCVPIAGPWVVVPAGRAVPRVQVQYQLNCPRGFIVGGVDAELTAQAIDVSIVGTSGSPVSPGVTTSSTVVFVASYVGPGGPPPTFRPHAGCIPATGGGQRTPTGLTAVTPPGEPTARRVRTVRVRAGGTTIVVSRCRSDERLVAAYAARAFGTAVPPGNALVVSLRAQQRIEADGVVVTARGGRGRGVVQVAAVCAAGGG